MIIPNYIPSAPEVKALNAVVVQWPDQSGRCIVSIQTDQRQNIEFLQARAKEILALYNGAKSP